MKVKVVRVIVMGYSVTVNCVSSHLPSHLLCYLPKMPRIYSKVIRSIVSEENVVIFHFDVHFYLFYLYLSNICIYMYNYYIVFEDRQI